MNDDQLKQKALSGLDAVRCCENGHRRAIQEVTGIISDFIREALDKTEDGSDLAFVPAPVITTIGLGGEVTETVQGFPRLIRVARGGPLVLGAVVLLGASALAGIAGQTAALDTLSAISGAIGRLGTDNKTRGNCRNCVEKKLWSQSKPIRRSHRPHRTRVG